MAPRTRRQTSVEAASKNGTSAGKKSTRASRKASSPPPDPPTSNPPPTAARVPRSSREPSQGRDTPMRASARLAGQPAPTITGLPPRKPRSNAKGPKSKKRQLDTIDDEETSSSSKRMKLEEETGTASETQVSTQRSSESAQDQEENITELAREEENVLRQQEFYSAEDQEEDFPVPARDSSLAPSIQSSLNVLETVEEDNEEVEEDDEDGGVSLYPKLPAEQEQEEEEEMAIDTAARLPSPTPSQQLAAEQEEEIHSQRIPSPTPSQQLEAERQQSEDLAIDTAAKSLSDSSSPHIQPEIESEPEEQTSLAHSFLSVSHQHVELDVEPEEGAGLVKDTVTMSQSAVSHHLEQRLYPQLREQSPTEAKSDASSPSPPHSEYMDASSDSQQEDEHAIMTTTKSPSRSPQHTELQEAVQQEVEDEWVDAPQNSKEAEPKPEMVAEMEQVYQDEAISSATNFPAQTPYQNTASEPAIETEPEQQELQLPDITPQHRIPTPEIPEYENEESHQDYHQAALSSQLPRDEHEQQELERSAHLLSNDEDAVDFVEAPSTSPLYHPEPEPSIDTEPELQELEHSEILGSSPEQEDHHDMLGSSPEQEDHHDMLGSSPEQKDNQEILGASPEQEVHQEENEAIATAAEFTSTPDVQHIDSEPQLQTDSSAMHASSKPEVRSELENDQDEAMDFAAKSPSPASSHMDLELATNVQAEQGSDNDTEHLPARTPSPSPESNNAIASTRKHSLPAESPRDSKRQKTKPDSPDESPSIDESALILEAASASESTTQNEAAVPVLAQSIPSLQTTPRRRSVFSRFVGFFQRTPSRSTAASTPIVPASAPVVFAAAHNNLPQLTSSPAPDTALDEAPQGSSSPSEMQSPSIRASANIRFEHDEPSQREQTARVVLAPMPAIPIAPSFSLRSENMLDLALEARSYPSDPPSPSIRASASTRRTPQPSLRQQAPAFHSPKLDLFGNKPLHPSVFPEKKRKLADYDDGFIDSDEEFHPDRTLRQLKELGFVPPKITFKSALHAQKTQSFRLPSTPGDVSYSCLTPKTVSKKQPTLGVSDSPATATKMHSTSSRIAAPQSAPRPRGSPRDSPRESKRRCIETAPSSPLPSVHGRVLPGGGFTISEGLALRRSQSSLSRSVTPSSRSRAPTPTPSAKKSVRFASSVRGSLFKDDPPPEHIQKLLDVIARAHENERNRLKNPPSMPPPRDGSLRTSLRGGTLPRQSCSPIKRSAPAATDASSTIMTDKSASTTSQSKGKEKATRKTPKKRDAMAKGHFHIGPELWEYSSDEESEDDGTTEKGSEDQDNNSASPAKPGKTYQFVEDGSDSEDDDSAKSAKPATPLRQMNTKDQNRTHYDPVRRRVVNGRVQKKPIETYSKLQLDMSDLRLEMRKPWGKDSGIREDIIADIDKKDYDADENAFYKEFAAECEPIVTDLWRIWDSQQETVEQKICKQLMQQE